MSLARSAARARLAVVVLLALATACQESRSPAPALDERHVVTVDGTEVRYNGKLLPWKGEAAAWQEVLGPCARRVDDILVWDELGLYVHVDPYDLAPQTFVVLLGRARHSAATSTEPDFWPRRTFPGRLTVDGALLHHASTVPDVNREKRKPSFRRGHLDTLWYYVAADGFEAGLELGHDGTVTAFDVARPLREKSPPDYAARVDANAPRRARCGEARQGGR